jgi:hypothetical protein
MTETAYPETQALIKVYGVGQCRDRTHARNGSEPLDPVGQYWIALKRADQGVLGLLTALDRLPAEL